MSMPGESLLHNRDSLGLTKKLGSASQLDELMNSPFSPAADIANEQPTFLSGKTMVEKKPYSNRNKMLELNRDFDFGSPTAVRQEDSLLSSVGDPFSNRNYNSNTPSQIVQRIRETL